MKKKALFVDIDGTLITDDKEIPQVNSQAIDRILAKGHCVVISTGRPLSSAKLLAEKLGLTGKGSYIIAYNGGVLYDTYNQKTVFKSPVPKDVVKKIFAEANKRELHIQTYDDNDVLVEPCNDDHEIRLYCSRINMKFRVIDSVDNLEDEPVKLLAIDLGNQQKLKDFIDFVNKEFGDSVCAFFSSTQYVEIVKNGLNKGDALRRMAQILGVAIEDTVAAGDQANDIDMIKAAGIGCAVSNATAEVKEIADYVTELDNNNGAVAEIIEKFIDE